MTRRSSGVITRLRFSGAVVTVVVLMGLPPENGGLAAAVVPPPDERRIVAHPQDLVSLLLSLNGFARSAWDETGRT